MSTAPVLFPFLHMAPYKKVKRVKRAKDFSLRRSARFSQELAQMERSRIRATSLREEPLFFHRLQEQTDRAVADLTSVLDSLLDGFTEVNADENPRHTVLFRCLCKTVKLPQHL